MQHPLRPRRHRQQGMTLIIAMVMLLAIGLASAAVMRGALSADLVANNTRVQTLANQAAQMALRFCETQVETPDANKAAGFAVLAVANPQNWTLYSNWSGGTSKAYTLPAAAMASANSTFTPATMPQCMAEVSNDFAPVQVIIVTARGFSPDYAETAGRQTAGSVVWLQSTLRVN